MCLSERLFTAMLGIIAALDELNVDDFDLTSLRENIVSPVAEYLSRGLAPETATESWHLPSIIRQPTGQRYARPIFISGEPGIGKTTLPMVLDEALTSLAGSGSSGPGCRDVIAAGQITGFFADKGAVSVTPLRLFEKQTAVLSARDWNNILRHWTFDETIARQSATALDHFASQLEGKVVIVDEAELEGYVYFTESLAERGVLVLLSSNLPAEQVHLAPERVSVVTLKGPDHRAGDLARVCLAHDAPEWFDLYGDLCRDRQADVVPLLAGAVAIAGKVHGKSGVCLDWTDLQDRPLLKDDFAQYFKHSAPDYVLLDGVPFFSALNAEDVDLTFLGHLYRFVNLVDAVHDCQLPLVVRGTHHGTLDSHVVGSKMKAMLDAYDSRTGDKYGQAAWIEWSRCLSRLRSREALNARLWSLIS